MAGANKHRRRKKRASRSSSAPTSTPIRPPRSSAPLGTTELAARLGLHPSTVRRRVIAGTLTATVDAGGRYHFAAVATGKKRKKVSGLGSRVSAGNKRKKQQRRPPSPSKPKPETRNPKPASKRPPFRKKRSSRETRPAAPTPRKKKRPAPPQPGGSARPTSAVEFPFVRHVEGSQAPTIAEAAPHFGVSSLRLLEWVKEGRVRALLDSDGVFHIPAAALQARQLALKRKRKKRGQRASKKRPVKKATGKKLVRRKKKRVRKTKPARQRFIEAIASDTGPSIYAVPIAPPIEPTAAAPMPREQAAQRTGNAMRDFVMARPRWERLATGRVFHDLKTSFRSTYGERQWKLTYAWIVDEWGLEDYIFDYEALRDS